MLGQLSQALVGMIGGLLPYRVVGRLIPNRCTTFMYFIASSRPSTKKGRTFIGFVWLYNWIQVHSFECRHCWVSDIWTWRCEDSERSHWINKLEGKGSCEGPTSLDSSRWGELDSSINLRHCIVSSNASQEEQGQKPVCQLWFHPRFCGSCWTNLECCKLRAVRAPALYHAPTV